MQDDDPLSATPATADLQRQRAKRLLWERNGRKPTHAYGYWTNTPPKATPKPPAQKPAVVRQSIQEKLAARRRAEREEP